ncbi:hypothetical protein L204_100610 [Cryptococcus depauperatus]
MKSCMAELAGCRRSVDLGVSRITKKISNETCALSSCQQLPTGVTHGCIGDLCGAIILGGIVPRSRNPTV